MQRKLNLALAEAIATMIQALRLGEVTRARQHGLTALAVFASHNDMTVDDLLNRADPGSLGEGTGIEHDVVRPEDTFEVFDPANDAPHRLVRRPGLPARD
jgi:hypothetical protein